MANSVLNFPTVVFNNANELVEVGGKATIRTINLLAGDGASVLTAGENVIRMLCNITAYADKGVCLWSEDQLKDLVKVQKKQRAKKARSKK